MPGLRHQDHKLSLCQGLCHLHYQIQPSSSETRGQGCLEVPWSRFAVTKDVLISRKELRETRNLFGNRSYPVGKRFDVIPRSNNFLSILLQVGCESIGIFCYFNRKGILASLSSDSSYKSGSTFVEICQFSRRG